MYAPVDLTQPLHPSVAPLMDKKLQRALVKAHKDEFTQSGDMTVYAKYYTLGRTVGVPEWVCYVISYDPDSQTAEAWITTDCFHNELPEEYSGQFWPELTTLSFQDLVQTSQTAGQPVIFRCENFERQKKLPKLDQIRKGKQFQSHGCYLFAAKLMPLKATHVSEHWGDYEQIIQRVGCYDAGDYSNFDEVDAELLQLFDKFVSGYWWNVGGSLPMGVEERNPQLKASA